LYAYGAGKVAEQLLSFDTVVVSPNDNDDDTVADRFDVSVALPVVDSDTETSHVGERLGVPLLGVTVGVADELCVRAAVDDPVIEQDAVGVGVGGGVTVPVIDSVIPEVMDDDPLAESDAVVAGEVESVADTARLLDADDVAVGVGGMHIESDTVAVVGLADVVPVLSGEEDSEHEEE
jgi:hypothetical protein